MAEKSAAQGEVIPPEDFLPPPNEGQKAEQEALDEAAQAAADEADRQKERADKLEEFNKAAYEESISGQELPPSVQAEQDAQKRTTERKTVATSTTKTKGG